jgi:hypothetical protein
MKPLRLVFLALLCGFSRAAPPAGDVPTAGVIAHDLGAGLEYFRVHVAPADLPAPDAARGRPCVIDLRFARAEANAATIVQAWIHTHATPRSPVLILANTQTDTVLLGAIGNLGNSTSVLTIGTPGPRFTPDIAVQTPPEAERRAYDALESGVAPAILIAENLEKARNDEASLSRDRSTEESPDRPAENSGKERASPPIDTALQRAVQLHRALLALKKV